MGKTAEGDCLVNVTPSGLTEFLDSATNKHSAFETQLNKCSCLPNFCNQSSVSCTVEVNECLKMSEKHPLQL